MFRTEADKEQVREVAREVAREEIASLAGLVLRRVQGLELEARTVLGAGADPAVTATELAGIFGEVLRDFGATPDEPGPAEWP